MSDNINEIPYYIYNGEGVTTPWNPKKEAYIDDEELKALLLDFLGDKVSDEDIEDILKAASDDNLTEEEFDSLLDEFILKHR